MPDRERKRVPDDRSDIPKESFPKSLPTHPWDTKVIETTIEMKQLRVI